ncbi:MAG TPA: hypothetical protein VG756_24350 [Pseudonocardiaceae bacterium]|nr:hypothetical protein [Pseudonocardiaceae bacterium]
MRRSGFLSSRTLAIVAVSVFALIGCCLLAWWQWTRYESASGTLQNLGYVLQWPLFGFFPGFMFWRIHKAAQQAREESAPEAAVVPEQRPARTAGQVPAESAPDWTDQLVYRQNRTVDAAETDPELAAYNSYLATLSAREQHT